jgi:hypothetical protein
MSEIQQEFLDKQLAYAVLSSKFGTAQHLIAIGAKPDAATLLHAALHCQDNVLKLLLSTGVKPDAKMLQTYMEERRSQYNNLIDRLSLLLETGVKPDTQTLLYAVAHYNDTGIKMLLATGVKPDAETLDYAVKNCSAQKVKLLTDALKGSTPKKNSSPQNKP